MIKRSIHEAYNTEVLKNTINNLIKDDLQNSIIKDIKYQVVKNKNGSIEYSAMVIYEIKEDY